MQYGLPSETDEWQQVAKVDFTMSEKHSLFGRYIATSQFTPPPFSLEAAEENLLVTRIGGRDNLAQTFTLGENYVINSTHAQRDSLRLQPAPTSTARAPTSSLRLKWASTPTATCRTTCC